MAEADEKGAHSSGNSLCVVGAEALLILAPFVVMGLVLAQKGQFSRFPYMPEWGVAGSALTGLSMVRFATGLLHARAPMEAFAWERVLLLFSLIVAFAFVPSLLVMSLVLLSENPSSYLAVLQIVLFLLALFLFISLGWAGEHVLSEAADNDKRRDLTLIRTHATGD